MTWRPGGGGGAPSEAAILPIPGWTAATGAALLNESAPGWLGIVESDGDGLPGIVAGPAPGAGAGCGWAWLSIGSELDDGEAIEVQIQLSAFSAGSTYAPTVGLGEDVGAGAYEGPCVLLNGGHIYEGGVEYRSDATPPWSVIVGVWGGLLGDAPPAFIRFRRDGLLVAVAYSLSGAPGSWFEPSAAPAYTISGAGLTRLLIGGACDLLAWQSARVVAWRRVQV